MKRIHAFVSGRVQGVFFRAHTRDFARRHGISGWVRNLDDGRVEAVAEGDEDSINEFVRFLHTGSPAAEVDDVDVEEEDYQDEFTEFSIRYA